MGELLRPGLALVLAASLVACLGKDGGDDDDDGGGSDDGSDGGGSDGATDSGWSDDDGGGGGGGGDCPALLPLDDTGTELVYEYVDGATISGSYAVTWTGPETRDGETVYGSRTTSDYRGDGFEASFTTLSWYRCNSEGAWLLEHQSEGSTTTSAGESPSDSTTIYSVAPLIMKADATVGDRWDVSYDAETIDHISGVATPFSTSYALVVVRADSVTVPAGSFDTLVIETDDGGGGNPVHYAAGVGAVASISAELVAVR